MSLKLAQGRPYRGALEIMQDLRDTENRILELEGELRELTGMTRERFELGMRALVLPDPEGGEALMELRRQFGGAL
jgi:hypothetical protein